MLRRGWFPPCGPVMIHYSLVCEAGHGFEGWFRDSSSFDQQASSGQVACPLCGGTKVNRALMAPAITSGRGRELQDSAPPLPTVAVDADKAATGVIPASVLAVLQRLREEVERNCENLGGRFPDEARRIAAGEAQARGIYGDATPEEAEALRDEGIEIQAIPWVRRSDG